MDERKPRRPTASANATASIILGHVLAEERMLRMPPRIRRTNSYFLMDARIGRDQADIGCRTCDTVDGIGFICNLG
ncbi:hypothetical protein AFLA_001526 [Aspergillus flavus NRRL3357]|nr:hypothetical protein AFLA_001526 [Aspergillus flavus NRRL3357]